MTADHILQAAAANDPESIFSYEHYKTEARRLLQQWHQDVNSSPQATEITQAILKLRELAEYKTLNGLWRGRLALRLEDEAGKTYEFKYIKSHEIDVGRMYIGRKKLVFVVDEDNADLYDNALHQIRGITYPNDQFRTEFERFLPRIVWANKTSIGRVVVMDKDPRDVLLHDVLLHSKIPERHVAWVVNRIYNIVTFLDHIGLVHGGIDPQAFLINPQMHGGILVGGWWYTKKNGQNLTALPSHALHVLPKHLISGKKAVADIDQIMLKAFGIMCYGDSTGVGSSLIGKVPARLLDFLRQPSVGRPLSNYQTWETLLREEYGPPKFIDMDLTFDTLYNV